MSYKWTRAVIVHQWDYWNQEQWRTMYSELKPAASRTLWFCHRNFGPENFGPLDQNFHWKNGPPGPIFSVKVVCPWKFGPGHANWKQSVVHLTHVRKSFPCLLFLQFHTSLFSSGAFLWLVDPPFHTPKVEHLLLCITACMAILLSRVIVHTLRPSAIIYSQFASVT